MLTDSRRKRQKMEVWKENFKGRDGMRNVTLDCRAVLKWTVN
jgi:hypothetical protein